MGRRRTACDTCAAIKTVCSSEAPCARCKRLSLTCSLTDDGWRTQSSEPVPVGNEVRLRRRHSKSSAGCSNCRTRRKKCDENRPTCGDCVRLGISCDLRQISLGSSPSANGDIRVGEFGAENPTFDNYFFDWISVVNEEYLTDAARISNLAHSSALEVLPDARASDDKAPSDGISFPSTALANLAGITPFALKDWTTGERHLLNHFLQSVARSLVMVKDDDNPFISEMVPMALESSLVRHALAALSACHLSRIYPDFERNLLMHRSRALQDLKTELKENGSGTLALAATLLMCLTEICAGNSRKWLLYLHGAKALLVNVSGEVMSPSIEYLIELYNYLCCMASMTSKSVPRTFGKSLVLGICRRRAGLHPFFGIAVDLYNCLLRINRIANTRSIESEWEDPGIQDAKLEAIELDLQSWTPPELDNLSADEGEVRAAAFAIQWATMLRLRQLLSPSVIHDDNARLKGPADNILSALSLIRPGSRTETHLLFPLFIAGTECEKKAGRLTIEYRINIMGNTIGFGNINAAHGLLDEIWRQSNRGEKVNWEELVTEKNPGLLLF